VMPAGPIDPSDQILYTGDAQGSPNAAISLPSSSRRSVQYVPTIFAGYSDLMGFHRHLLDDEARTGSFIEAVERTVRPGDIVIDVGSGTGVLAMAACRAGAAKVYAVEHTSIVGLAREVARRNGFGDRIAFVKQDARRWHCPVKADVIVSECFGMAGVGGTMIPIVADVSKRCLREGGSVVPRRLSVWAAPVESAEARSYLRCWSEPRFGFDFSAAQEMAANNIYIGLFNRVDLLAIPQEVARVEARSNHGNAPIRRSLTFRVEADRTLDGFAIWFDAELCDGLKLETGPDASRPTIWQQSFFPLPQPVSVPAGAGVSLDFAATPDDGGLPMNFSWNGQSLPRSFPPA